MLEVKTRVYARVFLCAGSNHNVVLACDFFVF